MTRKGFTLIELLVVVAIICILSAILFPVFSRVRAKARATKCVMKEKQIAQAMGMYEGDYDGWGPTCGPRPGGCFAPSGYGITANFTTKMDNYMGAGAKLCSVNGTEFWGTCPDGYTYELMGHRGGQTTPWRLDGTYPLPKTQFIEQVAMFGEWLDHRPQGASYEAFISPAVWPPTMPPGSNAAAHAAVNNIAFMDGHVKGCTPKWMYDELYAPADADGIFRHGLWAWWWRPSNM